ncbi:hypothetical protein H9638_05290 [Arthrobacter sp. Sa2BUA2]|uniref:DUF6318 domain-containing protein n=1 Tax=Arthrobacter pullicola TaxID=2762224 RepID=A0ABR8YGY2_9MICC|nr:DUF6318 family protein [Arthrobacter pullicola]MBD8043224.1 hypothetical protein [Arthrobacter pullicola]
MSEEKAAQKGKWGRQCLVLVAALILMSGCSAAAGTADPAGGPSASIPVASGVGTPSDSPTPPPAPTPSYSQASGDGPAANVVLPELPEMARQETKEGFLAFIDHWYDLVTYGYETGDVEPIRAISGPDCIPCANFYEGIPLAYANGGWWEGGNVEVDNAQVPPDLVPGDRWIAYISARQRVIVLRDSTGTSRNVDAGRGFNQYIEASFTGDGWYADVVR